jgi:hypothetical protein
MKLNTVASILIALLLAAVAAPAFAGGGSTVDPDKPSTTSGSTVDPEKPAGR